MTVLTMARAARHPKSSILYFRKVIPERYRARAGMREFKRSLGTADPREAKKHFSAIAAQHDVFIERLEAPPLPAIDTEPTEATAVTPGDLHALAGDLWRGVLSEFAATPAPPNAFSGAAPNGPWGASSEPWSGQRYQIQRARRAFRRPSKASS